MKWKEVSEERYTEMLEILPPLCWTDKGFLVGEPWRHKKCSVTGWDNLPAFAPFLKFRGKYYEGDEPLTIHEFRDVEPVRIFGGNGRR
jgi:hypothetical protein